MAHSTYPLTTAGLAVPVLVGLDGKTTAALHAAGRPIPAPVLARGLLDTCTDMTAIAARILQQLGMPSAGTTSTLTAAGPSSVRLFEVSFSITGSVQGGGLLLTEPALLVSELTTVLPDADVLIGLDMLLRGKLLLDGPAGQFTLEF
jgi:hypothetical protein